MQLITGIDGTVFHRTFEMPTLVPIANYHSLAARFAPNGLLRHDALTRLQSRILRADARENAREVAGISG